MIKHVLFAAGLAFAASPKQANIDPYAKYDLMLDHAQANIVKTQAAISEIQAMNEAKVMAVAEKIDSVQEMAETLVEQMQIVERVMVANKIEIPRSMEEWEEDSIRTANMQRINKTDEKTP